MSAGIVIPSSTTSRETAPPSRRSEAAYTAAPSAPAVSPIAAPVMAGRVGAARDAAHNIATNTGAARKLMLTRHAAQL